jgi:hypothetical protein
MKKTPRAALRLSEDRDSGAGRSRDENGATRASGERGAILILAMVYLVAVGLIVAALSTWATNDLNNSTRFASANSLTLAATDMTDVAINYVRYNPVITSSQLADQASPYVACWGGDALQQIPVINGNQIAVWCSTVWNPLSYVTRDVTFVACPISVATQDCVANPLLTAEVRYDDYPPAPARSAPIQDLCSVWCGAGITVVSWKWGTSTTGAVTGVASSMTFTNEPSDTSATGTTQAAVTVDDSSGNAVAGDWVQLSQQSGPTCGTPTPVDGVNAQTSTLSAETNSSGVAEFTSISPQCPGNYTLAAVDGAANATSTNFVVSQQKSVITVTSAAPTNATQGQMSTVAASATASSGDPVAITSATPTICSLTASDYIKYLNLGTCTLDFNDTPSLNPNYAAAVQVTQSFAVGGLAATHVAITLSPVNANGNTIVGASGTTNVTITMTLENAVNAPVTSTSPGTTVVLSDIGCGFFSATNGAAGTCAGQPSLNVNFPTGATTETAYFGDQNIGPDTISAVNGTTNWGSAPLTIQAGAPTQVAISPSTTTPAVSSVTNTTLNFQLEDQFGNAAVSSTGTTLTLSDSGPGFFATSNGTTGTATLNITFASGSGTATAYIGNKTSGADTISADNGASVWATSTLTFAPGAATTVQVTLTPAAPAKSASTNASVALQLLDQFGNHATTSGVSIVLSNSGSGFFDKNSGVTVVGGATTTLTLSTTGGAVTGYFGDNTVQSDTITATGPGFTVTIPPFTV